MRITIVNYSRRRIGGTEQNLDVVLPEFERRGHRLQFVYIHDEPATRAAIRTGDATELVDAGALGIAKALARVRAFRPELINVHGEIEPAFQRELQQIAASAYCVHNYYGTCISGLKTHQFPVIQPCQRTFGPECLLQYYPRRCGGLSPVTMLRRYNKERDRLEAMTGYDAVVTYSAHMEREYLRHGLHPARVHGLPYEVTVRGEPAGPSLAEDVMKCAQLLFVGRMEKLKGGHMFLKALAAVHKRLVRKVDVHLAGEGPGQQGWKELAEAMTREHPGISVQFHGWMTGSALEDRFRRAHLLVVPSLWPEPFGKVGPEAALYGVPAVAFSVGGVGEWLVDGVNGFSAPGDPPTAEGLAQAIVECLRDRETHVRLGAGARARVKRFDPGAHVDHLLGLFARIRDERAAQLAGA